MTPGEILAAIDGYRDHVRSSYDVYYQTGRQLFAWQTAHLMNVSGKTVRRDLTARDLLDPPKPFERQQALAELAARIAQIEAGPASEDN